MKNVKIESTGDYNTNIGKAVNSNFGKIQENKKRTKTIWSLLIGLLTLIIAIIVGWDEIVIFFNQF